MASRTRTLDKRNGFTGTRTTSSTTITKSGYRGGEYCVCHDTVGQRQQANQLQLTKTTYQDWSISGTRRGNTWDDYPMYENRGNAAEMFSPNQNWANSFYLRIVGATNPQQPHLAVPTALGELKDLPGLVKNAGDLVGLGDGTPLNRLGNTSLGWQFGVMPLLGDLGALYNFGNAVQGMLNGLQGLRNGKPIRRRCFLGKDEGSLPLEENVQFESAGIFVEGTIEHHQKYHYWGSCSWEPTWATKAILDAHNDLLDRAWRLAGGFTPMGYLRTAWNLLPWSWLVDWFARIDALLGLLNNTLLLYPADVCLMYHSVSTHWGSIKSQSDGEYQITGVHRRKTERKYRYVLSPTGSFGPSHVPLVNGRRASILGSLVAQRS